MWHLGHTVYVSRQADKVETRNEHNRTYQKWILELLLCNKGGICLRAIRAQSIDG